MAEPKKILLLCEGDDDLKFLVALQRLGLVPGLFELKGGDKAKRGGKSGLIADAEVLLRTRLSVVILRDLDELAPESAGEWLLKEFQRLKLPFTHEKIAHASPRVCGGSTSIEGTNCRVVQVVIGLSEDDWCKRELVLTQFAMDDYLLRLLREQPIYEGISEIKHVGPTLAWKKLSETAQLLRDNGISVTQSKRFLQLLWGITGFRASPAEFVIRVLTATQACKQGTELSALFQPLVEDLAAVALFFPSAQPATDSGV